MPQDPTNYWMQMERLERLIRAAELKAGLIFSFHGLLLGLFFDRLESFQLILDESSVFKVLIGLWILFVGISIYHSVMCFIPRIESKYDKNVFFFKDAVNSFGDVEEYTKKLIEVCGSEKKLFKQLSEQIHVESKIIERKFSSVKKSMKYLAISFIAVLVSLIFWLISLYFG